MKKIINFKIIFAGFIFLTVLSLGLYFAKAQTKSDSPPTPTVKEMVVNDGEGLSALVFWQNKPGVLGYKVVKRGVNGQAEATDEQNFPLGFEDESAGGWYLDAAVVPGDTYTYSIITYDRGGEEAAPASVDLKIEESPNPTYIIFPYKNVSGSDVYLYWSKPLQCQGALEYEVFRDGESIGKTRDTSYIDRNVDLSVSHDWFILAYQLLI